MFEPSIESFSDVTKVEEEIAIGPLCRDLLTFSDP